MLIKLNSNKKLKINEKKKDNGEVVREYVSVSPSPKSCRAKMTPHKHADADENDGK